MNNDPLVLAYLAGAIDADGHITITRSFRTKGKRYSHSPTYYHPRIGYTSTEKVVPELLQETFGGGICTHCPKNKNHQPVFIWSVTTASSAAVSRMLIPYLRQKRKQAETVVELCAVISAQHSEQRMTQKPPYHITPEQLALRERLWEMVAALNKPRNRRVYHVGKKAAGRLLDGTVWNEFPTTCSPVTGSDA